MARVRVTQWRAERIIAKVPRILNEYGPVIGFQLQQEISKDQYDWPTRTREGGVIVTRRNNGQEVTTPRDIVDTGTLLNSQTAPQVQGNTLTIRWTAPYSRTLLEDHVQKRSNGSYIAPGRDWITPALREKPLLPFLVERWQQLASGQR
jgi:hypothetical protein